MLEKVGFEVITATSASQALDILENTKVDIVLSDVLMPRISGTELAKLIKHRRPDLPVVLVSGVNEIPPDAVYADLFISKLEGPVTLCEKVKGILGLVKHVTGT